MPTDSDGRKIDLGRLLRPHAASLTVAIVAVMVEGGAKRIGCPVIPAGTGNTEMQLQAIAALRPAFYAGTPSFLKMIVEKGTLTVVYGGEMQQEQPGTSPGESTGAGVTGGKEIVLHPGDILHIPAGIPHWVKLNPGVTTTYFVIKEK